MTPRLHLGPTPCPMRVKYPDRGCMAENTQLNADMSRRVAIDTAAMAWQPSPSPGVWRMRLELIGGPETGRVTSLVRYEADS